MATGSVSAETQRNIAIILVLALALGWWAGSMQSAPSKPDRPFITWVAKAAKSLLWIALVAEEPPQEQTLKTSVGEDGYARIDHGRGW